MSRPPEFKPFSADDLRRAREKLLELKETVKREQQEAVDHVLSEASYEKFMQRRRENPHQGRNVDEGE